MDALSPKGRESIGVVERRLGFWISPFIIYINSEIMKLITIMKKEVKD